MHRPDTRGSFGTISLTWLQTLGMLAYAMLSCFAVNDVVKMVMTKRRVPLVVALLGGRVVQPP